MVRGVMVLDKLWIIVEQRPTVLAVGAGADCLDILFSCLSFLSSFSLSVRDRLI